MAKSVPTAKEITDALNTNDTWKKVLQVMLGKKVEDAAVFSPKEITFVVMDGFLRWKSPWARVTLEYRQGLFHLTMDQCNNGGADSVKSLERAVGMVATSAWHVGCRGVI